MVDTPLVYTDKTTSETSHPKNWKECALNVAQLHPAAGPHFLGQDAVRFTWLSAVNSALDKKNNKPPPNHTSCPNACSHSHTCNIQLFFICHLVWVIITPVHTVPSTYSFICPKWCRIFPNGLFCKTKMKTVNDQPPLTQCNPSGSSSFKSCSKWRLYGSSPGQRLYATSWCFQSFASVS